MPHGTSYHACIFKCGSTASRDQLSHYVECEALWKPIISAAGIEVPPCARRLGITSNPVELFCVAGASYICHARKGNEHITPIRVGKLLKAFSFLGRNPIEIKLVGLGD